jgi:large subunit ribosomal protein L18
MRTPAARFAIRKQRQRLRLRKVANVPYRLSVFRASKNIYAQLIDDDKGVTIVSASSRDEALVKAFKGSTREGAEAVGKLLAEKAKAAKIDTVFFDRGAYLYHGRVKALADGARAGGLKF